MMRRWVLCLIGAILFVAPSVHADISGIRVVNLPIQDGTTVTVQNYTVTGSTQAGQNVMSYTVPVGMTFYLQYAESEAYYLNFTTAVSNFGAAYLSVNGQHIYTTQLAGTGRGASGFLSFNPPLSYPSGSVIAWLVSPQANTGTVWYGNIGGYYR